MHYWADLQSVHGFRCYGAEREMSASACIHIYAWFIISEYDIVLSPMRELRKYGKSNEH